MFSYFLTGVEDYIEPYFAPNLFFMLKAKNFLNSGKILLNQNHNDGSFREYLNFCGLSAPKTSLVEVTLST